MEGINSMLKKLLSVGVFFLLLNLFPISLCNETNHVAIDQFNDKETAFKIKINNGSLSGFVKDSSDNPIEGAVVSILIACGGHYYYNLSDSSGYYYIGDLPIYNCYWNVSVYKIGYRKISLDLSIDENTTYDFIMKLLGKTLYVGGLNPGNFSKIQDAINSSSEGDTVFVYDDSSPYYEHIILDKSIYLIGEKKETTVIDAQKEGTTIRVLADGCLISNFTFLNCEDNIVQDWGDAVIKIEKINNIVIKNNIINSGFIQTTSYNNYGSIDLEGSNYCTIINNYITQEAPDSYTCGIGVHDNSSNNIISGNNISQFDFGINIKDLDKNYNNTIIENHIHHNDFGTSISNNYNYFLNNLVEYNSEVGVNIQSSYRNTISHNIISYNGVGEKFQCGIELMGYYNNNNNYVYNNNISFNNPCGLQSEYSDRNVILNNNFIDNYGTSEAPEVWWGNAYIHVQDGFFKKDFFQSNYWSDTLIFFPKIIHVYLEIMRTSIMIKWFNFDWNPASEPYDIPMLE
jgi:hypothetical protein